MDHSPELKKLAEELIRDSLKSKRIKINPDKPFRWASGYMMPIYNDNRQILISPESRELVREAFSTMIFHYGLKDIDIIAGTSTAGISPATTLADSVKSPLIYVRDKPKDYGLKNRIEGIAEDQDLNGMKVLLIEDLISTGGSSASAIQAIRDANGSIDWCFAIFDYGFPTTKELFKGNIPYNSKGEKLKSTCNTSSIITYDELMDVALKNDYLTKEQVKVLDEWRAEPFLWGDKRGFYSRLKK